MRVVSQSRDYSADFNRCEVKREENSIQFIASSGKKTVGLYESEERAADVFLDIHQKYEQYSASTGASNLEGAVYYMPEV